MPKPPAKHWNYRLVRKDTGYPDEPHFYDLHEVYYDHGKPAAMTEKPATFGGYTPEEAAASLERALSDARTRPVLIPADEWPEQAKDAQ